MRRLPPGVVSLPAVLRPPPLPGSYLVLETTNRCSLACVHCTVSEPGHPHHAQTGMLSLTTAQRVFDDLARVGARFDTLIPFWLGEPLIHPEFGAIYRAGLRAAVDHGTFGQVELHTNATHLGRDRVRAALNTAPVRQVWHLSLDAATRDAYRRVKGVDRFTEVEANVEAFLTQKARLGAPWPRPVFQFIVGRNNAHEAEAFRARWERACDARGLAVQAAAQHVPDGSDAIVFFRQLDAPTPEDQAAENQVFRDTMARLGLALPRPDLSPERLEPGHARPCASPWKSPTIAWDGTLTMCTRDNRAVQALGNVNDTPFSELWWGAEAAARRARVASGSYAGLPVCGACFIPYSANTTDLRPEDVAAWAGLRAGAPQRLADTHGSA